jgi:hypothetical protein
VGQTINVGDIKWCVHNVSILCVVICFNEWSWCNKVGRQIATPCTVLKGVFLTNCWGLPVPPCFLFVTSGALPFSQLVTSQGIKACECLSKLRIVTALSSD